MESFQDLWRTCTKSFDRLSTQVQVPIEDERALLELVQGLVQRFEKFSESEVAIPEELTTAVEMLKAFRGFSSITDAELEALRGVLKSASARFETWMEKSRRKSQYLSDLKNKERIKVLAIWIAGPIVFAALVMVFAFLGSRVFFGGESWR